MHRAQQILEALLASLITAGIDATLMTSWKPDATGVNLTWGNLVPLEPENLERIVWQMTLVCDLYIQETDALAAQTLFQLHADTHRVVMDEANSYPGITFLHGVWPADAAEPEFSTDPDLAVPYMRVAFRIDFHTSYADLEA